MAQESAIAFEAAAQAAFAAPDANVTLLQHPAASPADGAQASPACKRVLTVRDSLISRDFKPERVTPMPRALSPSEAMRRDAPEGAFVARSRAEFAYAF